VDVPSAVGSDDDASGVEVASAAAARKILLGPALTRPSGYHSRLGKMLVERGLITREELNRALDIQATTGERVGEALVTMGAVSSEDLARVLAEQLRMPFIDLHDQTPDADLLAMIPSEVAERLEALPVTRWGTKIVIAMAAPNRPGAIDELRRYVGIDLVTAVADPTQLRAMIQRFSRVQNEAISSGAAVPSATFAAAQSPTTFVCPGCHTFLNLGRSPWVLQELHPKSGRYYIWDDDPTRAAVKHVCA
jgi:hypothetical protein